MFDLIDKYVGIRLGVDLADVKPEQISIVESPRRLSPEMSYGFVHALWWVRFDDGRSVISVPPGCKRGTGHVIGDIGKDEYPFTEEAGTILKTSIESAIKKAGLAPVDRILLDLAFACNGKLLHVFPLTTCQKLGNPAAPLADGVHVPPRCIEDGVAFGVMDRGVVVSVAYAHRSGVMQDCVADIGVETTASHRRQGLAKATVSALVNDFTARGGQARYGCSPENSASIATAVSVGFRPYAESLILAAHSDQDGWTARPQIKCEAK